MEFDGEQLERAEFQLRADIWRAAPAEAVEEAGVRMRWFGPILATSFAELYDVVGMNLIQGAAEPGAVAEGHPAEAAEWMEELGVEFLIPVTSGRPGAGEAESWLSHRGYEPVEPRIDRVEALTDVLFQAREPAVHPIKPLVYRVEPPVNRLEAPVDEVEAVIHLGGELFVAMVHCGEALVTSTRSSSMRRAFMVSPIPSRGAPTGRGRSPRKRLRAPKAPVPI